MSSQYHKIQSIYKRDRETGKFRIGDYSIPEFGYLADLEWEWTEKVDGTNIRVIWDGDTIEFRGKTDKAQIQPQLFSALANMWIPLKGKLAEDYTQGATFYGEGYGPKIQKGGGNYRDNQSFVLFDVKINRWWLTRDSVNNIGERLGIDVVPVVGHGNLSQLIESTKANPNSLWGDFRSEGYVARPTVELFARNGNRIIVKCKCKDFDGWY